MKRLISEILYLTLGLGVAFAEPREKTSADTATHYDLRVQHYRDRMARLIPTQLKLQAYGGIGLVSVGFGWDYGRRRQWETDLLFGFIPKYDGPKAHVSMTLKETYTPWSVVVKPTQRWMQRREGSGYVSFEPFSVGMMLNTVYGDEFWTEEPDRYPPHYYNFSSRIRIHIFVGESWTLEIPNNRRMWVKSISAFYELGTYDLKLVSGLSNTEYLSPRDWLNLSFGLRLQIF